MPLATRVEDGIVFVEVTGELTLADLLEGLEPMLSDPDFEPGMPQLLDLAGATGTELDGAALQEVVKAVDLEQLRIGASRLAIAAADDFLFGMARMYQSLAHPLTIPILVTRDRAEALAWLRAPGRG